MNVPTQKTFPPLLSLLCLLVIPGCTHQSQLVKRHIYIPKKSTVSPDPLECAMECAMLPPTLTVWIHGTKFSLDTLFKEVFDAKPGLKHIKELPAKNRIVLRMKALTDHCAEFFPYESVYCFCWSGKLNTRERQATAEKLHQTLYDLMNDYEKEFKCRPKIRLVCHSHGANVALNLARINAQKDNKITIDSLILFACPVQCETKEYVFDPMFEKIYSLYSPLDWVQIVAPQWACRFKNVNGETEERVSQWLPLSERRFSHAPSLRQAWVKINNRALSHADFTTQRFLRCMPVLLETMDEAYSASPELGARKLGARKKELILHIKT
jgi:hypothetical protein